MRSTVGVPGSLPSQLAGGAAHHLPVLPRLELQHVSHAWERETRGQASTRQAECGGGEGGCDMRPAIRPPTWPLTK
eukprot:3366408-Rhodomonas_salina.1